MREHVKSAVLHAAKVLGLFRLSRRLTRDALRILCYHGISLDDEHEFRRKLFMRSETFRRRLDILARYGFPVLGLHEAVERLERGDLPPNAVVLTFDDGWRGCLDGAFEALAERGLPATLYLTTYYVEQRQPVFDVLVGYLFWKSRRDRVNLDGLGLEPAGDCDIASDDARGRVGERIVTFGNESLDAAGRRHLTEELARRLDVDFEPIRERRLFELMTFEEAGRLKELGVDLQLHTHRHRIDLHDAKGLRREIEDNRERLASIAPGPLTQFCYPSGVHHERVFPWLSELGIRSATTTDVGLCDASSSLYALPRIVDGEDVSEIEFEAELSGMLEVTRRLRRTISGGG